MTATSTNPDPLLAEQGARWRFTVHARDFSANGLSPAATGLAELSAARSRRVELQLNGPAKVTFSVDGASPAAFEVHELTTDVLAWRTDPVTGAEALMARAVVSASEDTVTADAHTVNFTCWDYLAVMARRYLTPATDWTVTQMDQDDVVGHFVDRAVRVSTSSGAVSFDPGSRLPLLHALRHPDGTLRVAKSGQLRDRTYTGGSSIGELLANLAAVINGFDYDLAPLGWAEFGTNLDALRVFYPAQGVGRADVALVYGANVAGFTRSANSAEGGYGNYVRVLGDNGGGDGVPQLIAEAWNPDSNDVGRIPVGLWMATDNASDVSQLATLQQKAAGDLATMGALVPSYSLTLRPGWYRPGFPAMGDTVPLVLQVGRLDVSTTVRVVGISYAIGDDGQEDVELTVGRPALTLDGLFRKTRQDINALARR